MTAFNYNVIEKRFDDLLAFAASSFTDTELKEIRDFLEVREYGLALETFIDIVKEEHKRITIRAYSTAEELVALMGVSDEVDLESVRRAVE